MTENVDLVNLRLKLLMLEKALTKVLTDPSFNNTQRTAATNWIAQGKTFLAGLVG